MAAKPSARKPKSRAQAKPAKPLDLFADLLLPMLQDPAKGIAQSKVAKKETVVTQALQQKLLEERSVKNKPVLFLTKLGETTALAHLPLAGKIEEIGKRQPKFDSTVIELQQECQRLSELAGNLNLPAELSDLVQQLKAIGDEGTGKMRELMQRLRQAGELSGKGEEYLARMQEVQSQVAAALQAASQEQETRRTELQQQIANLQSQLEAQRRDVAALKEAVATPMTTELSTARMVAIAANAYPSAMPAAPTPVAAATAVPTVAGTAAHSLLPPAVTTAAKKSAAAASPTLSPLDEQQLVAAMEQSYRKIVAAKHLSRVASLPELYEQVHPEFPALTIVQYKELLNKLCNEAVVDLHPVNDKGMIQKPEFVIKTYLGEIYYVSWR